MYFNNCTYIYPRYIVYIGALELTGGSQLQSMEKDLSIEQDNNISTGTDYLISAHLSGQQHYHTMRLLSQQKERSASLKQLPSTAREITDLSYIKILGEVYIFNCMHVQIITL